MDSGHAINYPLQKQFNGTDVYKSQSNEVADNKEIYSQRQIIKIDFKQIKGTVMYWYVGLN